MAPPDVGDPDAACKGYKVGAFIDGDLKIWEFIYDKAVIAAMGNAAAWVQKTKREAVVDKNGKPVLDKNGKPEAKLVPIGYTQHPSWPLYNTFTENISFTATLGASATPMWKLARVSADSSGTLLSATRTNTDQLTITMGPVQTQASPTQPAQLSSGAQTQHTNTVLSNQIKGP
jgi:hypothetical protein